MDLIKDPYYQLFNFDFSQGICGVGLFSKHLLAEINKLNPSVHKTKEWYKKLSDVMENRHALEDAQFAQLFNETFNCSLQKIDLSFFSMNATNELLYLDPIGKNSRYTNAILEKINHILCIESFNKQYSLEQLNPFIKAYIELVNGIITPSMSKALKQDLEQSNQTLLHLYWIMVGANIMREKSSHKQIQLYLLENSKSKYLSHQKIA